MKVIASKFAVNTTSGLQFFNLDDIVRLEASSNYTNIYFTNGKSLLTAKVLKAYASLLEPLGFVRTHRAHLVNSRHINQVRKDGRIVVNNETFVAISRRMKTSVLLTLMKAA